MKNFEELLGTILETINETPKVGNEYTANFAGTPKKDVSVTLKGTLVTVKHCGEVYTRFRVPKGTKVMAKYFEGLLTIRLEEYEEPEVEEVKII